jgi:MFS family permease
MLLLVLAGNMLLDAVEVALAVVVMPAIGRDLGLPPAGLHWVMTGFALGFGGMLPAGARLVERFGRRRLYLGALAVFAVASVVGALAGDGTTLIASRVVKGACAALTAPTGLAIIAAEFPDGPARRRALSVYSLVGAAGFAVGLLLAGALTGISWRWTFGAPAVVAVVLLAAAVRLVPHHPEPVRPVPCDVPAVPRRSGPPLPPGLFRGRLARSAAGAAALNGGYWGLLLVATLGLQLARGWPPATTALLLLPGSALLVAAAPFAGRLIGRFGTGRLILAGAILACLGNAVSLAGAATPPYLLTGLLLIGAAFAASFAALHAQALSDVDPPDRQAAGAAYQTAVQLGGAATLLLVTAASVAFPDATFPGALPGAAAGLCAVLAVSVAGLLAAAAPPSRKALTANPTSEGR